MNNDSPILKPCPFCGGDAFTSSFRGKIVRVGCAKLNCVASMPTVETWNTRHEAAKVSEHPIQNLNTSTKHVQKSPDNEQQNGRAFDEWCASVKDCGHEVQPNSATARQRRLGWDAAMAAKQEKGSHFQCKICGGNPTAFPYVPEDTNIMKGSPSGKRAPKQELSCTEKSDNQHDRRDVEMQSIIDHAHDPLRRFYGETSKILKNTPFPAPHENGWSPIETAPKDGQQFLVYREDAGVFVAWWESDRDDGDEIMWTPEGEDLTADHPTHWMPFPKPPIKGEKHE